MTKIPPNEITGPPDEQCPKSQRSQGGHDWQPFSRYLRCGSCGEYRELDGTLVVPLLLPEDQRPKLPPGNSYNPDAILADPFAHPVHREIAAINIGTRDRGEQWSKCPNCGKTYMLTEAWDNTTVCSDTCGEEYTAYIMNPDL